MRHGVAQAGRTALPEFALDGDLNTYWSPTGGTVCCSESSPAWLVVSLGALREVGTVQIVHRFVHRFDMTYTVALANASDGPWQTVGARVCSVCRQNSDINEAGLQYVTVAAFALPSCIAASFVRLHITWSSAGGVGGCSDLCDWAADVQELRAFSPGTLPTATMAQASPPSPPLPPECVPPASGELPRVVLMSQSPTGADLMLRGDAALGAPGSGPAPGDGSVQLTRAVAGAFGAVEFTRVIRPSVDCPCLQGYTAHGILLTVYVRLGGGVLPGEGLVVSIVDATRQTPGATRFLGPSRHACGVRAALPANAMSVVLDMAVSEPSCDGAGTGVSVVSTLLLDGGDSNGLGSSDSDVPQLFASTLEQSTSLFRRSDWVPLQALLWPITTQSVAQVDASGTALRMMSTDDPRVYAPLVAFIDGTVQLDTFVRPVDMLRAIHDANRSLDAFYVVVSARSGTAAADAHAVGGIRLVCNAGLEGADVLNWDGYRQPYSNVSAPPPPPPLKNVYERNEEASVVPLHFAMIAPISFGIAFAMTLLLAVLGVAWLRRCRVSSSTKHAVEAQSLLAEEAHPDCSSVVAYVSYNRAVDAALADVFSNKLRLCRLRVVGDAADAHSLKSTTFDAAALRALRGADAFAPLVTLASLQHLASLGSGIDDAGQALLAEWLAALAVQDCTMRSKPLLIRPVLVGVPTGSSWLRLLNDPAYDAALRTLHAYVAPVAAAAEAVDTALLAEGCAPLPAHLAALSVGDIVLRVLCGGAEATADLLDDATAAGEAGGAAALLDTGQKAFELTCRFEDLHLYIVARYLPSLLVQSNAGAGAHAAAA